MRVAYVSVDRGVRAFGRRGSSIHVQAMLEQFLARSFDVDLLTARLGGEVAGGLISLRIHPLPRADKGTRAEREQAALAANDVVRARLDREGPFDLVYERHALWSHAAMEYARDAGIPSVLEVNAPLIEEQQKYRGLHDNDGARESACRALSAASTVIAVSDEVAKHAAQLRGTAEGVHVVPNGVDIGRFESLKSGKSRSDQFTIGFVGTLKPWHGVDQLVQAFRSLHEAHGDCRLLIVGDGPMREELDAMSESFAGAIEFTGEVEPDAIPFLLQRMDVAVAPYPELDSFYFSPLKLFEYMAAGRAIVAARVGQIDRVLEDDVSALLYPAGKLDALTKALDQLRSDPDLRRRLGRAARRAALKRHSWSAVADRVIALATPAGEAAPSASQSVGQA